MEYSGLIACGLIFAAFLVIVANAVANWVLRK